MNSLHNCVKVSIENEYFKAKLIDFYKENKRLKEALRQLKDENQNLKHAKPQIRVDKSTSPIRQEQKEQPTSTRQKCSVCASLRPAHMKTSSSFSKHKQVQTECITTTSTAVNTFDKDFFNRQNKKSYDKLCQMHHDLLKKYEDEVNMSAVKQGLINQFKLELEKCEALCKSYEAELTRAKSELDQVDTLKKQNRTLKIDLETLELKYEKCQKELDFFDDDFFEEIKTLKSKYSDALKLNKYYENLLFFSDKTGSRSRSKLSKVKFSTNDSLDDINDDMNQFSNRILKELNMLL